MRFLKFQSTHSRGVRHIGKVETREGDDISIHALARSATILGMKWGRRKNNFNPRTREECDVSDNSGKFKTQHFNPRTREECDNIIPMCWTKEETFQSTHSRGVRHLTCQSLCSSLAEFQSTHSRGVRLQLYFLQHSPLSFQSTHSRGVRHAALIPSGKFLPISIHALARSATLIYECYRII